MKGFVVSCCSSNENTTNQSLSLFLSTVCLELYCVAVKIYFELWAALIPFIHAYTWASISTATLSFGVSPTFFASMYLFLFRKLSRREK